MSPRRPSGTYRPISDYGLIGNCHSAALVALDGSIDWCCLPRFDSAAIFSRILDWDKGGYFQISTRGVRSVSRRYLPGTNILETTFESDTGVAKLTDFMPARPHQDSKELPNVSSNQKVERILECVSGSVHLRCGVPASL